MSTPPDTPDTRTLIMSEIMPPTAANFSGHVHGGYLMLLLDRVAYACAARYTGAYAVTLSVDQVLFKQPIYVGELVTFYASVNFVGKTSLEIGIKVVAEDLAKRSVRHTNTSYFTMVAVNEQGEKQQVPPLELSTQAQKYRFEEAQKRRQMRMDYQEQHSSHKAAIRQAKQGSH